jgi:hypothetical protein
LVGAVEPQHATRVTLTSSIGGRLKSSPSALYTVGVARRSALAIARRMSSAVGRASAPTSADVPTAGTSRTRFERTHSFRFLADYGAFRDLQRIACYARWQPLSPTWLRRTGGDRRAGALAMARGDGRSADSRTCCARDRREVAAYAW